jgi:hypothetical protein
MTNEPFWDELGIAWQALSPTPAIQLDRMKAHFRREALQIRLAVFFAALFGTLGIVLGLFTLWQGWRLGAVNFGVRGVAVLIVAGILWMMVATLWQVRRGDGARSLSDFAELGLARAKRSRRAVVLALAGCTVAAVLGVAGTILRTRADHPPALSPYIDLLVLAVIAVIVEALRRRFRGEEARFAYLRSALRQSA